MLVDLKTISTWVTLLKFKLNCECIQNESTSCIYGYNIICGLG